MASLIALLLQRTPPSVKLRPSDLANAMSSMRSSAFAFAITTCAAMVATMDC